MSKLGGNLKQINLKPWHYLAGVLALGLLIRLIFIDLREFWYDEAYSGLAVRYSWIKMWEVIINDVHPPLYYILLKAWTFIAGSSVVALRLFSTIFSLFLLAGIFYLARRLVRNKHVWFPILATMTVSVSPFFVDYAVEARAYAMYASFFVWAIYFAVVGIQKQEHNLQFNRWFVFSGILLGLMFWTHYVSAVGIGLLGIFFCWRFIRTGEVWHKFDQMVLWLFKYFAPVIIAGVLWLPVLVRQFALSGGGLWWVPKAEWWMLPKSLYAFLMGVKPHATGVPPVNKLQGMVNYELIAWVLFAGFLVTLLFVIYKHRIQLITKKDNGLTYLFLLALSSIGAIATVALASKLTGINLYVERYLAPYGVMWLFLFYYLLYLASKRAVIYFAAIYVGIALIVIGFNFIVVETTNYEQITTSINKNHAECVVVTDSGLRSVLLRYYMGESNAGQVKLVGKNVYDYIGWAIISEENITNELPQAECIVKVDENLNLFSVNK